MAGDEVRPGGADEAAGTVVVIVVAGPVGAVAGRPPCRADLGLVDALARLQVAARRLGCSVRLREVSVDLAGLLDLVGLAGAVGGRSALEARGQPEGGEQLGGQEVVPPHDAPA